MGKLCKILYIDKIEMADFVIHDIGYCPSCGNIFSPVGRNEIEDCPICHKKVYGRAIAINNGFIIEKDETIQ